MEHYLLQILKKTTDFIERHLFDDLTLDAISGNVYISKFHLLRIWKGATGTGLMEYVRRRRIAASLGDLLNHRLSLEQVAGRYGFGSERTYNRVFKEEFHLTPARWRKKPSALDILDRFNVDFLQLAGESLMFFKAVLISPALTLAGLPQALPAEAKGTGRRMGVEFFIQHRLKVINPVSKDIYYGYTATGGIDQADTGYLPAIRVDDNSILPPGMTIRRIPAHKYGVFTYLGLHRPEELSTQHLQPLMDFVQQTWAPTIEFRLREPFRLEVLNYARCNKQYCECDLYFPMEML